MSELRNCPYCDEEIRVKAIKCKYCKSDIKPIEMPDNSNIEVESESESEDEKSNEWVIWGFVIVIIIGVFIALSGNNKNSDSKSPRDNDWYMPADALFCTSEKAIKIQYKMLAQGLKKYYRGCFGNQRDSKVIMLDYSMMGFSRILVESSQRTYWVSTEQLERR